MLLLNPKWQLTSRACCTSLWGKRFVNSLTLHVCGWLSSFSLHAPVNQAVGQGSHGLPVCPLVCVTFQTWGAVGEQADCWPDSVWLEIRVDTQSLSPHCGPLLAWLNTFPLRVSVTAAVTHCKKKKRKQKLIQLTIVMRPAARGLWVCSSHPGTSTRILLSKLTSKMLCGNFYWANSQCYCSWLRYNCTSNQHILLLFPSPRLPGNLQSSQLHPVHI